MARAEAERARRRDQGLRMMELGLGMAAQGGRSAPSSSLSAPMNITVNGNTYSCQTIGANTNCMSLTR
jgi:hypothetical protein